MGVKTYYLSQPFAIPLFENTINKIAIIGIEIDILVSNPDILSVIGDMKNV